MKRLLIVIALAFLATFAVNAEDFSWKAKWISKQESQSTTNTWIAFRKKVTLDNVPKSLVARIGVDTKYWLWINGKMVVFEGGLKRGPAPGDGYYDKVEIAPYLQSGDNVISVLVCFFGKNGFSHQSSGTCAMIFDAEAPGVEILSDRTWEATADPAYLTAGGSVPNHRLAENNILYDARKFPKEWYKGEDPKRLGGALELGFAPGEGPLGRLVERPVPLWKDYGLKKYVSVRQSGDTVYCRLPYNCQFTPYLKVDSKAGVLIRMQTDHDVVTGEPCVHAEYLTCDGVQDYENLGWMSGEVMKYIVPSGVKVLEFKFRETGYDTDFSSSFTCDDEFLNTYWQKARRTLYLCMRDTYYDCPDRERAQWWGDEVNELNEAFFALSRSADKLACKGILELAAWQKPDGSMYAPIPTGNYYKELPFQILDAVGWYGFHNYYFYSGDSSFVAPVYDRLHKYLHEVWKFDADGMPIYRDGDWDWPDAGEHQDKYAMLPMWYYLALKGELSFAQMLGKTSDVAEIKAMMENISKVFNSRYWNGSAYITPGFTDAPDDRVQALAVISGVAPSDRYPALKKIFSERYNATTFMFPYVLDALCIMGEPEMAQDRMKKMYPTVMKDDCSTLYEHWHYEGTCNHAWAGGGIIIMGRKFAGIEPLAPGFRRFKVAPQMGYLKHIETTVDTNYGFIKVTLDRKGKRIKASITVPAGTSAEVPLSNGKTVKLSPGTHSVKI